MTNVGDENYTHTIRPDLQEGGIPLEAFKPMMEQWHTDLSAVLVGKDPVQQISYKVDEHGHWVPR